MSTKTLGIIGGMSWVSTLDYYRLVNEKVAAARGRQHSAELLLASVDFQPVVDAQARGDWTGLGDILSNRARALEAAGAGAFLIASNTMHLVADQVRGTVSIPSLDIFDATADAIRAAGIERVGLLGTRYTMSLPFFTEAYARRGIEVIIPEPKDAKVVNAIIFRELIHSRVEAASAAAYRAIAERLIERGAGGIVLGCTEIRLLLREGDISRPVFDTTALHAGAAARWLTEA